MRREHKIRLLEGWGATPQQAESMTEALHILRQAGQAGRPFHLLIQLTEGIQESDVDPTPAIEGDPLLAGLPVLSVCSGSAHEMARELLEGRKMACVPVDAPHWALRKKIEHCLARCEVQTGEAASEIEGSPDRGEHGAAA